MRYAFRAFHWKKPFTAALVIAAFLIVAVTAQADSEPKTRSASVRNAHSATVYTAPFSFNAVAVTWHEPVVAHHSLPPLEIRFAATLGRWSSWQSVEADEDGQTPNTSDPSTLIFTPSPARRVEYRVAGSTPPSDVGITVIDSRGQVTPLGQVRMAVSRFVSQFVAKAQAPTIISRAEWGADESYRFAKDGTTVLWPSEFVTPTTFIIHHTAGANGQPDLETAKAVVRGVYYYHAKVRGWGDIGYNYLVDQQGNVFEGRYGGDGIVGGHTYRDGNCKSKGAVANLNRGSIGIAVLGEYQNTDAVTPATLASLQGLMASKGRTLGIPPGGINLFDGRADQPNIIAHRDVDCTTCPGDNLYLNLDTVRNNAQSEYAATATSEKATLVAQSDAALTMDAGTTKQVWVDVRNDGPDTWINDPAASPVLEVPFQSSVRDASWISETLVTRLTTPEVAPGSVGRFAFTIQAPTDRFNDRATFQVRYGDLMISPEPIVMSLAITNLPYAAAWAKGNLPVAMFRTNVRASQVAYTNTGTQTWNKGEILLKIWADENAVSPFRDSSWKDKNGLIAFDEAAVAPGGVAHFSVKLRAPEQIGRYSNQFTLVKGDRREVPGALASSLVRVDSRYRAAKISETLPAALKAGWRKTVTVKVKNTGPATWTRSTVLELVNENGKVSALSDRSWPNQKIMRATFTEKQVKPGQTATFTFRVRAPAAPGLYWQTFRLRPSAGSLVMQDGSWVEVVRIDRQK